MTRKSRVATVALLLAGSLAPAGAMAAPITGVFTGIFVNPAPTVPPAVATGLGTSSVRWGIPCNGRTNCATGPSGITPPSSFTFVGLPFAAEVGVPFVLGTLEFFNGTVQGGTALDRVTLRLDGTHVEPSRYGGIEDRVIAIINTLNTADPIASADRALLPDAIFPGADEFGVLESTSAVATLMGEFRIGADDHLGLAVLGFGNIAGGDGFLDGFAAPPPVSPVPEPGAPALVGVALAALGMTRRRMLQG